MKVVVLINSRAGAGSRRGAREAARIRHALADAGIDADLRSVSGAALADAARDAAAAGPGAVVAAGGDGTLSTVAGVLAGTGVPLGVLPLGTFNHFAKDLGIPTDPVAAARLLATASARRIDLGDVNGRAFLNNASLGLYPRIVRRRSEEEARRGRPRWLAAALAFLGVLRRYRRLDVRVSVDRTERRVRTPFLFVGNNEYDFRFYTRRDRVALDRGHLAVYLAPGAGRLRFLRILFAVTAGSAPREGEVETYLAPSLEVRVRRSRVRVACDGEVLRTTSPLVFRSRARALDVIAPAPAAPGKGCGSGGSDCAT